MNRDVDLCHAVGALGTNVRTCILVGQMSVTKTMVDIVQIQVVDQDQALFVLNYPHPPLSRPPPTFGPRHLAHEREEININKGAEEKF